MKTPRSQSLVSILLLSSLVFLPGCTQLDWLKDKLGLKKEAAGHAPETPVADGSAVLASIEGKPLLTAKEFEKDFNNFVDKHPLGAVLKQMEGIEKQVFNGILSQRLLNEWVKERKIDQTPEYKEQLEQLKVMLNAKHFEMAHQAKEVSDDAAKDFFEKNRDSIPEAVISRGGTNAMGVEFDSEADAKSFLDKVRGKGNELSKIAKEAKVSDKVRDFKLVNAQSLGIDAPVRDKILALAKFPAYDVVKSGNKFWVVYVAGKEQAKYRPFDQVKAVVKERLTMDESRKAFETGIESLKKEKHVVDNFDTWYQARKGQNDKLAAEQSLDQVMPLVKGEEAADVLPAAKVA